MKARKAHQALTPNEVADKYRISWETVISWINTGKLRAEDVSPEPDPKKPAKAGSRRPRYRITEEALQEFFAARNPHYEPKKIRRSRRRENSDFQVFFKPSSVSA